MAIGIVPIRCRDCQGRYVGKLFSPLDFIYARCPRCFRQDLSTWDLDHYHIRAWVRLKLAIGAHPWRCEACRCNFASFRLRKLRFHYHRRVRQAPTQATESDNQAQGATG